MATDRNISVFQPRLKIRGNSITGYTHLVVITFKTLPGNKRMHINTDITFPFSQRHLFSGRFRNGNYFDNAYEEGKIYEQRLMMYMNGLQRSYDTLEKELGRVPHEKEILYHYNTGTIKDIEFSDLSVQTKIRKVKFTDFVHEYIETFESSDSSSKDFMQMVFTIMKFVREKRSEELYVHQVNKQIMLDYELFLYSIYSKAGKKFEPTTVELYIRKAKAIANYAIKMGLLKPNALEGYKPMPLAAKKLKRGNRYKYENLIIEDGDPRATLWLITPEELSRIEDNNPAGWSAKYDGDPDLTFERERWIFLFQTWTGMAYVDLVENNDIQKCIKAGLDGTKSIMYNRKKTGELAIVPVLSNTEKLLQKLEYMVAPRCNYISFIYRINKMLDYYRVRVVSETANEQKTHLGRHLFGCRMLQLGFSMESISRMMGHSSMKMTEKTYARIDISKINSDLSKLDTSRVKDVTL